LSRKEFSVVSGILIYRQMSRHASITTPRASERNLTRGYKDRYRPP